MSALLDHIQNQQTRACQLVAVLEAAEVLNNENLAPKCVKALVNVALSIACEVNTALDFVNLPEGGAA